MPLSRLIAAFGLLGMLTLSGCGGADGSAVEARSATASGTTAEDTAVRLTPVIFTPDASQGTGFNSLNMGDPPAHGTASVVGSQLNYQPNLNYFGDDQFTFIAITNSGSILGTATVTVTPINDAPSTAATDAATNEDTPLTITPSVTDPDPGDSLTLNITTPPSNGTAAVATNGSDFIYTPSPHGNQGWVDNFGYTVNDGTVSATGTVTITVADVNHAPTSATLDATPTAGTPTTLTPTVIDPDGDTVFTYTATDPLNGSVDTSGGNIVYTVAESFTGRDDFTFNVFDSGLSLGPITATIDVSAIPNARPVAGVPLALTTSEDTPVNDTPDVTDPEGDSLTFSIITPPAANVGTLTGGATIAYTPAANFNGAFTFVYQATDAAGLSMTTGVQGSVTVTPVNDPPVVIRDVAVTVNENTSIDLKLDLISDPVFTDWDLADSPPDTHRAELNGTVQNATVTPIAGTSWLRFVPDVNFDGVVNFGFRVIDADGASSTGNATVTVNNTNNPPSVTPLTVSVLQELTAIGPTVTDPDSSDNPTLSITVNPLHGSADTIGVQVRYTPNAGFLGVDQLTVTASDGFETSDPAVITIVVGKRTGDAPQDIVFGDFNGDGNPDIAVANELGDAALPAEVVSIFLGDGAGTLNSRIVVAPTNPDSVLLGAIALAAGDLNGDSLDDLVIVYQDNDSYAVALGNVVATTIVAGAAQPLGNFIFPRAPVLDNFDGAPLDLALVNSLTDEIVVLQGNGDGTFDPTPLAQISLPTNTSPWDLASGDLDGDAIPDLALVSLQRNIGGPDLLDMVDGFINDGNASFTQTANQLSTALLPDLDADLAMADLNGDNRADVVRTLAASDQVAVFLAGLDGTLSSHTLYTVGDNPSGVTVADTDGDGFLDIVVSNRGDGTITILPGLGTTAPGDGSFGAAQVVLTHAAPGAVAAGMLDAGISADIATAHPATDLLGITFQ